jgi:NAD(P)H-dependent flavin oxidoreductase YrpB (nitropropane dioxygenase family)
MGVAVSHWRLAQAVSRCGELGVVSGTGLDAVLARRLQLGDVGGHMRRAMEQFPIAEMAERVWERYFSSEGKAEDRPFKSRPLPSAALPKAWTELTVVANFVEVFLAKEGHAGPVGINLLEKIQVPTLPSLYGAMLAGVDYVLMGAGIPRSIPAMLDSLAARMPTTLRLDVAGALPGEEFGAEFDPREYGNAEVLRPKFLAIISSATLAVTLARKSSGQVDGFVVEGSSAGGHNAPPRGGVKLDETGQPIYGPRDVPDLGTIRDIGLPFWLAGSYAEPQRLEEARAEGAQGIQVGTAFAFCEESGIAPEVKQRVLEKVRVGEAEVFTDPLASPTGFPFKVLELEGSLSQPEVVAERERVCDLGYLRTTYRREDGALGYRCAAEPVEDYVRKGGDAADTEGRKCVCNGLFATVGFGQVRKDGTAEPVLVTAGDEVTRLGRFLSPAAESYSAADVIRYLRGAEDFPPAPTE